MPRTWQYSEETGYEITLKFTTPGRWPVRSSKLKCGKINPSEISLLRSSLKILEMAASSSRTTGVALALAAPEQFTSFSSPRRFFRPRAVSTVRTLALRSSELRKCTLILQTQMEPPSSTNVDDSIPSKHLPRPRFLAASSEKDWAGNIAGYLFEYSAHVRGFARSLERNVASANRAHVPAYMEWQAGGAGFPFKILIYCVRPNHWSLGDLESDICMDEYVFNEDDMYSLAQKQTALVMSQG
ncbi:hypothetical protein C8R44DRAFT_728567 [Mycena epipterygia]|nr:hypothetical protein C8R44DRAFT_728567 [Mycena epipterygia]